MSWWWYFTVLLFLLINCLFSTTFADRIPHHLHPKVLAATPLDSRLPYTMRPIDYYLRIQPYFPAPGITIPDGRNMTFDGYLVVTLDIFVATTTVIIHARNLNITMDNVVLLDASGNQLPIALMVYNPTLDQLTITSTTMLPIGVGYVLEISYQGSINAPMDAGLMYTSYRDLNGTQHFMVATKFEPIFARSMFPSFDEPAYKAIFHLTLIYPTAYVALSNMLERSTGINLQNGWSLMNFPPTPPMSNYLLAFAIGPFVSKSTVTPAGTLVRAWSWTGMEPYLDFAVDTSSRCLYNFGLYTNFTYPLPKADQLGLPEYPAGAMENWGLLIFKYQYLIYDRRSMPTDALDRISDVICHELAHQWFGDLVTTAWWDDLFLNEGFATYFATVGRIMSYSEQRLYIETALMNDVMYALNADANLALSHPVTTMTGPRFDSMTYDKGASLLRMINYTIGEETMRNGLRMYTSQHQFGNTNHEDLWSALTTACALSGVLDWCGRPLNVSQLMNPWILQQGFPLITVNNSASSRAILSQQPFIDRSLLPADAPFNYSWPTPIFYTNYLSSSNVSLAWITQDHCTHDDALSRKVHWELENIDARAFYRIDYDDEGWNRLINQLQSYPDSITLETKIQLISDSLALVARKQSNDYQRFLDLTLLILSSSANYAPWSVALDTIDYFGRLLQNSIDYPLYQMYMVRILKPAYEQLGWTAGNWDNNMARLSILPYAIRYNIADSVNQSLALFANLLTACQSATDGTDSCNPLHPDIRRAVYCSGIKYGPATNYDTLFALFQAQYRSNFYLATEYMAQLEGLSCTQDAVNLKQYVNYVLSDPYLISHGAIGYLSKNPIASTALLDYLNSNTTAVINASDDALRAFLNAISYAWFTDSDLDKLIQLNSTLFDQVSSAQRSQLNDSINAMRVRIQYNHENSANILRWLYDNFVPFGKTPWPARLSGQLRPLHYHLFVQPYFPSSVHYPLYRQFTFDARVNITFTVINATNQIVLNAHRLMIDVNRIRLTQSGNQIEVPIFRDRITKDYQNAFLTIPLSTMLNANSGNWTLEMSYTGFIIPYPASGVEMNTNYFDFNGQKAWIFSTDFELGPSTRSLLPCFDEPAFKAVWTIECQHPSDMIALANGIEESIEYVNNNFEWKLTRFRSTPPMSSYLLALAIGHLSSHQVINRAGTLIRLWAWTGAEEYSDFGLKIAADTLDFMGTYFNSTFPLAKLDILALPQYSGGFSAMENFGLTIGIYTSLLVKPMYATSSEYSRVAETTSHELAHQWFGDLVSPRWWNVVFLNEAFATYWSMHASNYSLPEQSKYIMNSVRFNTNNRGLQVDASYQQTRPIVSDMKPVFSEIVYTKGSAALNMLSNTIGADVFQMALINYIQQNAYGNADDQTLWTVITQAVQNNNQHDWNGQLLDVATFMGPYTLQSSFPILSVQNISGTIRYTQMSFLNTSGLPSSPFNYQWSIPVYWQSSDQQSTIAFNWFVGDNGGNDSVWTRTAVANQWRIDNVAFQSIVRVLYDDWTWSPIQQQLYTDPNVFDIKTRAMLIADTVAFIDGGFLPWTRFLDLSLYLTKEMDHTPWSQVQSTINNLIDRFRQLDEYSSLLTYVNRISMQTFGRYAWTTTGAWDTDQLSAIVTDLACRSNGTTCLQVAVQYFEQFIVNCEHSQSGTGLCNPSVKPDQRRNLYCYGIQQSSRHWFTIERLYHQQVAIERYFNSEADNLLYGLSCSRDIQHINRMIRETLAGTYPYQLFNYIASHDSNADIMWAHLQSATHEVINSIVDFDRYVYPMAEHFNRPEQLIQMEQFLNSTNAVEFGQQETDVWIRAMYGVGQNLQWLNDNRASIAQWLNNLHGQ